MILIIEQINRISRSDLKSKKSDEINLQSCRSCQEYREEPLKSEEICYHFVIDNHEILFYEKTTILMYSY